MKLPLKQKVRRHKCPDGFFVLGTSWVVPPLPAFLVPSHFWESHFLSFIFASTLLQFTHIYLTFFLQIVSSIPPYFASLLIKHLHICLTPPPMYQPHFFFNSLIFVSVLLEFHHLMPHFSSSTTSILASLHLPIVRRSPPRHSPPQTFTTSDIHHLRHSPPQV